MGQDLSSNGLKRTDTRAPDDLGGLSLEYSFETLQAATDGFHDRRRLGSGAAGAVYRGCLRGGSEVAVKALFNAGPMDGFEEEVRTLSRFRHPNLVTLMGWGQHEAAKYLVYELLLGGDVIGRLLKCKRGETGFDWQQRTRVGTDAACGLSYMMNCEPKAFHRDIKPANILLDANGTAKMADFGLAGTAQETSPGRLTVEQVAGTPGYACPVYMQTKCVSEKSEVYSFGVVLLELLLNERPAISIHGGKIAYPLRQIVDPGREGAVGRALDRLDAAANWPVNTASEVASLAIQCVNGPEGRPLFDTIVQVLRNLCKSRPPGGSSTPLGPGVGQRMSAPAVHSRPPAPASPEQRALAEVVLECIHAEGVDLASLAPEHKSIGIAVGSSRHISQVLGRQHQGDFFERLVPKRELLTCVSRSHVELSWEAPSTTVSLKVISPNGLIVDDSMVTDGCSATVDFGMRLGFRMRGAKESFLELHALLRSRAMVASGGSHPAVRSATRTSSRSSFPAQSRQSQSTGTGSKSIASQSSGLSTAQLECFHASGTDLSRVGWHDRVIALRLDRDTEIGRQHQQGFFENLLNSEPQWMNFVSRSHCTARLARAQGDGPVKLEDLREASAPSRVLKIENHSNNIIFVDDKAVPKGDVATLHYGSRLEFAAAPAGKDVRRFLRFELRPAPKKSEC